MFILTKMKSVVRLDPNTFERELPEALSEALTEKLANKVLKDVGLVIALWDILSIGDSFLFPGDGASHTRVEFRILVFRPFMEEVLTGKVIAIINWNGVSSILLMEIFNYLLSVNIHKLSIKSIVDQVLYKRRSSSKFRIFP